MDFYALILIFLFGLAILDLIVGVANDAVNFTNSAIGSQAASRRVIMTIATLGIIAGTSFSSGMMELARTGFFNPEKFLYADVMIIFLAVMFTDVILLDLYNTFGLPTSTTISLVFELMGASVAIGLLKIVAAELPLSQLGSFINSDKALAMITSIFVSVALAFLLGIVVQFFSRLLFTFDYRKKLRHFGAAWCALAMTFLSYYMIIKGLKGSIFTSAELLALVQTYPMQINLLNFVLWLCVFQSLIWFTKIDILKIIVLTGTFALSLAFAANDLVNFIGVPLAGLAAFNLAMQSPDPAILIMDGLRAPVQAEPLILAGAALVMAATLWFSRKARRVTATEVGLARQSIGEEQFESYLIAGKIVSVASFLGHLVRPLIPATVRHWIFRRMDTRRYQPVADSEGNIPSFDLLRAAVNLMVASSLISIGTSLKLPLSTTYVTFMVAMGSSLSDRAWGSGSAVFRISGVLTVIGGWFVTALMAFTVAFIFAGLLHFGGLVAVLCLAALAAIFQMQTRKIQPVPNRHPGELP